MRSDPNLYVIAAPSGGGKTSLINALLDQDDQISLSISHTTRDPRPAETNDVHYHFVNKTDFQALIDDGAFLEHALVYGNYYGTGREAVRSKLAQGYDVMLDIDWQGAQQVRASFPECCSIFILPPSLEELRKRLSNRGQDSKQVINMRMHLAQSEIRHCMEFDFQIINDDFDAALEDLHSIIRHNQPKRKGQKKRIDTLLAELLENV